LIIVGFALWRVLAQWLLDLPLFVDEAQYWYWAQHLDWGYYSKPPGIALIIALTTGICGDSEFCSRAGTLIVHPLTALTLYWLSVHFSDRRTALWAAVAYLSLPLVAASSLVISTDVLLLLFWAIALVGFRKALHDNHYHWWLLTALVSGLGLLTKYTMGVFALSALLFLLMTGRGRMLLNPRLIIAVLIAFSIWLPNLWWNFHHDFITFQHTSDIAHHERAGMRWDELTAFIGAQFGVFGVVFFPLLLWSSYASLRQWLTTPEVNPQQENRLYLVIFTWVFLLVISLQALLGGANANWAAPAVVAGVVLVTWHCLESGRRRLLGIAIVLNLLLSAVLYHYPQALQGFGVQLSRNHDVYARMRGWDTLGTQFEDRLRQFPEAAVLAASRKELALLYYYARPSALASWNPDGGIRHHFDLGSTLTLPTIAGSGDETLDGHSAKLHPGGYLWVLKPDAESNPADYFKRIQRLEDIHVRTHHDKEIRYRVFYVQGR
jgi:4-amino-4-deoxy-L-arabinose transferase-like glycosyltransferase